MAASINMPLTGSSTATLDMCRQMWHHAVDTSKKREKKKKQMNDRLMERQNERNKNMIQSKRCEEIHH